MTTFVLGQRWIVDSEPDLGLGIVVGTERRTVDIFFERGECERRYATERAPLTRIIFEVGDTVTLADGSMSTVASLMENDNLIIYQTENGQVVPETQLSSHIELNQPFMRLMTGQIDKPKWFDFRRKIDQAMARTWQSRLNGLLGVRANLIPHQLYVSQSACNRENVRVLLADEVGLGKTIEAGMILMRMLKLERISRALIVVPEALQVQWLVELARRFDLMPELYADEEHDFDSGQIHIIPHAALATEGRRLTNSDFDIVLVDEAHHIEQESEEFTVLEQLAIICPHLVLLTATPEQLGLESHFARLQLLDSAKFTDIAQFKALEADYAELNTRIRQLPKGVEQLVADYQLDYTPGDAIDPLVNQLLDMHGVGRVMFRNVRKAIAGFPQRIAHSAVIADDSWEAKYEWLAEFIKSQDKQTKILVITHSIDQVFGCEQYLWKKHGLDAAVFHEDQSLIDRDKAAAYFAETDNGSQILICSEIGSEGRNFQFSHHLVCLDLPEHPELLEQRIGRLDRIGQQSDVNIHIPMAIDSLTETRFSWFHQTLECVEHQNPAAGVVHEEFWEDHLNNPDDDKITEQAHSKQQQLRQSIEQGRDALLEMNSCRQPMANTLKAQIDDFESETPFELTELASELLQFHFEETNPQCYSLVPSDKMLVSSLPGIPLEGCEITFDREIACQREDIRFITWDSPFIIGLWELINQSEIGSASVATLTSKQLPAGHCLLEACFDLSIQSALAIEARPFLPSTSVRSIVLDVSDKDLSAMLSESALQESISDVRKHIGRDIIKAKKDELTPWFKRAQEFAENQKNALLKEACNNSDAFFNNEIQRLTKLTQLTKHVDAEEVNKLKIKQAGITQAFTEQAHLQLSALRLIVISDS